MKPSLLIFFLLPLLPEAAFAQLEYQKVDAWADTFAQSYTDAADLGRQLTAPFHTDTARARALYTWMASHIRYDCDKFRKAEKVRFPAHTEEELKAQIDKWEADQIRLTLRKKKGVCQDYSRLFKALCDAAGLECIVVEGWGRPFYNSFRKMPKKPNHTWNAVKIGGQWRLIDVTWAAGYTDEPVKKFTADFQPGYFLTPPDRFVEDHLPLEEKWQLTSCLVSREAFTQQAYSNSAQTDFPIDDYWPKSGKLYAQNRQMEICVKFTHTPPALAVASNSTVALDFQQTIEDGFIVLRFKAPARGEVGVYGGPKKGRKIWLLRYTY